MHVEDRSAVPPDRTSVSTPYEPANRSDLTTADEKFSVANTVVNPPGINAVFVLALLVKLVILLPIAAEINDFQNS